MLSGADLDAELLGAVGDFDRWPRLLQRLADRHGAIGGAYIPAHDTSLMRYTDTIQAGFEAYIADGIHLDDKRLALYPKLADHKVVDDANAYSAEEMAGMFYYQEWLPAQDHGAFVALRGGTGDEPVVIALYRSRGDRAFDDETKRALEPVSDALMRASALDRAVGSHMLRDRLDWHERAGGAVLTLDRRGLVTSVSEAAGRLLGSRLGVHGGRLSFADAEEEYAFDRALAQSDRIAQAANLGVPHERVLPDRVFLRAGPFLLGEDVFAVSPMLALDVHPIVEGYRNFVSAAHIVVLSDPFVRRSADSRAFAALWDLTAREAELVCHLVDGHLLAEAARAMNIREASARTYLKAIYRKTGTRAQSELVARAARLT